MPDSLETRLRAHVEMLAKEIGERNIWHADQMDAAAKYIETYWQEIGFTVHVDEYQATTEAKVKNLWVEVAGTGQSDQIVVVGAHYDSVLGCPGANDNSSGVAALLELSRLLRQAQPAKTFHFVAFANEEPPFFLSKKMGSRVHAIRARQEQQHIVGMISLETLAYYTSEPGSQKYPFPFGLIYPDTANFVGIVSNLGSRRLMKVLLDAFRRHSSFPAEGVAAPGWMTGIGWSDHWSFWREGFQAVMITDTALFRYAQYHTEQDTPDKLNYPDFAHVVKGLREALADLAGVPAEKRQGKDPH